MQWRIFVTRGKGFVMEGGNHTGGTSVFVVQTEERRFEIQRCGAKLEGRLTGKFLHAIQRVHMFTEQERANSLKP